MTKELEKLIDRHGVYAVLDTIAGICSIKAEPNNNLDWLIAEAAIDTATSRIHVAAIHYLED